MKLGLFSDPHYSSQKQTCGRRNNSRSLEKIKQALVHFEQQDCDLILCLGDLIDSEDTHEKEIANLISIRDAVFGCKVPFVNVMGNHDAFAFTVEEFYDVLGNAAQPVTITREGKSLIFIDACHFASGVHYAPGDDDWMNTFYPYVDALKNELAQAHGDIYLFMHQNIDPFIHESHCLSNAAVIRSVLEENGRVKCVIQGHYHEGAEHIVNGIRYLTLPAMCEREDAVFLMDI